MIKHYVVEFWNRQPDENGKTKLVHAGSTEVSMLPNDKLDVLAKAFRAAPAGAQNAAKTRVTRVRAGR